MNARTILQQLRDQPEATCESYGFVVDYDSTLFRTCFGGACRVEASHLNGNVIGLRAVQGHGDYFFPYTHLGGLAGRCQVRDGAAEGTLVLTGGMNGCALEVHQESGYKMFYHDANGSQLSGEAVAGPRLCRIEYRDYDSRLEMANRVTSRENPYAFQTLLTIKKGKRWVVVHTGIVLSRSNTTYSTYRSTITPVLTSFPD